MRFNTIKKVYFSPMGTTRTVADHFVGAIKASAEEIGFGAAVDTVDLIRTPLRGVCAVSTDALLVVVLPVYAGRIPAVAREMLLRIQGCGGPAVALVTYGNRAYDDALLELCELLQICGFCIVGAGAFVTEHAIFPEVAAHRPDGKDKEKLRDFARVCVERIHAATTTICLKSPVPGKVPYRKAGNVPLKPRTHKRCTGCHLCSRLCPVQAISSKNARHIDKKRCISCGACIACCPVGAKYFGGAVYTIAEKAFKTQCAKRLEPEVF